METLYGPWHVEVVARDAALDQRVVISGSQGSDGDYPGTRGTVIGDVTGEEWSVALEWRNATAGGEWQPSGVRREAGFTLQDGLFVTLGADDGPEGGRDGDFNDLVVRLINQDPNLDPMAGAHVPHEFTISDDMLIVVDRPPVDGEPALPPV